MGGNRAVGWAVLDTAVLQWAAGGGSPELGAAVGPAEMRSASIELARRVDAIRDFVADGVGIVGVQSVRVPLADRAAPRMPPAAQTGPEFIAVHADSFGTGGKCLRCGQQATPGTVCDGASSAPKMPNGPWTEQELSAPARHGGGTDGYRCQCAGCVAARHQATIDKAFSQQGSAARALYGDDASDKLNRLTAELGSAIEPARGGPSPADPALRMDRWPLDELDWLERRADYLSNQLNEFNRRLRTLLRRVRG